MQSDEKRFVVDEALRMEEQTAMPDAHIQNVQAFLDEHEFTFGEGSTKGVRELAQEIWDNEAGLSFNSEIGKLERVVLVARVPITYTRIDSFDEAGEPVTESWQLVEGYRQNYEMNPDLEVPQKLDEALRNDSAIVTDHLEAISTADLRSHVKWLSEKMQLNMLPEDGGYEAVKQELLVALLQSYPEQMGLLKGLNEEQIKEFVKSRLQFVKDEVEEEPEDSPKSSYKGLRTIYRLPTFALELTPFDIGVFITIGADGAPLPIALKEIKGKKLRVTNLIWERIQ